MGPMGPADRETIQEADAKTMDGFWLYPLDFSWFETHVLQVMHAMFMVIHVVNLSVWCFKAQFLKVIAGFSGDTWLVETRDRT